MIAGPLAKSICGPLARQISGPSGFPYPRDGRVLDLAAFTYTYSEVRDKSPEGNEAVLYSGRAVSLDGVNDTVSYPTDFDNEEITVKVLLRSATTGNKLLAGTFGELYFNVQSTGIWKEYTDTSTISGSLDWSPSADVEVSELRVYDSSGTLVHRYLHNEYVDETVDGLDGLLAFDTVGGTHGTYTGCTAVTQIGFDSALAGLGAYGDKLWLDGVNDSWRYNVNLDWSSSFELEFTAYRAQAGSNERLWNDTGLNSYALFFVSAGTTARLVVGGFTSSYFAEWSNALGIGEIADFRLTWDGSINKAELFKNGISLGQRTIATPDTSRITSSLQVGAASGGSTFAKGLRYGFRQDGGLDIDPVAVNGSPNTVAELRTTPPQVLGMDFNLGGRKSVKEFDFSATTDGMQVDAGSLTPAQTVSDGIVSYDDVLTFSTISGSSRMRYNYAFEAGKTYRVTALVYYPNPANVNNRLVLLGDGAESWGLLFSTVAEWKNVTATFTVASSRSSIWFTEGLDNDEDYHITNLVISEVLSDDVLIPESLTKGTDALGNAIESPRSNKTFNADGSGYGLVPDDDSLDLTTEATWVMKGNFYGAISTGEDEDILSKAVVGTPSEVSWLIYKNDSSGSDKIAMIFSNGATTSAWEAGPLAEGQEQIVSIVYNGAGATNADKLKVYIDGTLVTAVNIGGDANLYSSLNVTNTPLILGGSSDGIGGSVRPLKRAVSDVKIYNRALTAEEVAKFK